MFSSKSSFPIAPALALLLCISEVGAFSPTTSISVQQNCNSIDPLAASSSSALSMGLRTYLRSKRKQKKAPPTTQPSQSTAATSTPLPPFDKVQEAFPGAITNHELVTLLQKTLESNNYETSKTLVATSLCCDEVNRPLETALCNTFHHNFNMGGLAGFPFGGNVAFGAMAAHIPDGGSTLVVYGPHVGVDSSGVVGTVERRGRASGGSCCGSAVAASGFVSSVYRGEVVFESSSSSLPEMEDVQQFFVNKMLLPYAEKLDDAENTMAELPYALYDAQTEMMDGIVEKSAAVDGTAIAVLGGIQINTPPGFEDYYLPLRCDLFGNDGEFKKQLWN